MIAVVRGMLKSTRFSKDFARMLVTWRIHDELLNNCIDCVYILYILGCRILVGSETQSCERKGTKVIVQSTFTVATCSETPQKEYK